MNRPSVRLVVAALLLALVALAGSALAQGSAPALARWVIGSGGGPLAAGDVFLDGTLGQPMAGRASAGAISLDAGYWQGLPVLAVSKSDGLEYGYAGWSYQYTIAISNTGAVAATGLVVTDTLPADSYILALPTGATQEPDGSITWRPGELEAGSTLTLTLEVGTLSDLRGPITNTVQVSCEGGPLVSASDATTIVAPPVTPLYLPLVMR